MTYSVTLRHNFETSHRLPHVPGKCQSLHGHSWWAEVTIAAGLLNDDGMVVEFGAFKRELRAWIDEHLDHGIMLGRDDPLREVLIADGHKVFTFEHSAGSWPTVENVAAMLAFRADFILFELPKAPSAHIVGCKVSETHVNSAAFTFAGRSS